MFTRNAPTATQKYIVDCSDASRVSHAKEVSTPITKIGSAPLSGKNGETTGIRIDTIAISVWTSINIIWLHAYINMRRRSQIEEAFWSSEDEYQRQMLSVFREFSTVLSYAEANPTNETARLAYALADTVVDYARPYIDEESERRADEYLLEAITALRMGNYTKAVASLREVRKNVVIGWSRLKVIGRRKVEAKPIEDEALELLSKFEEEEVEMNDASPSTGVPEEDSEGEGSND